MTNLSRASDRFARVLGSVILAVIGLLAVQSFTLMAFPLETLVHLALGWALFLFHNVPKISWNADTILSGTLGLIAGTGAVHYLGKRFFEAWRWRTTTSIALALPVLFFTSFLVPAIANSLQALASGPFLQRRGEITDGALQAGQIRDQIAAPTGKGETYPICLRDCLGELSESPISGYFLQHEGEFLFTGAGMPIGGDTSLPLLLCPPYERDGRIYRRVIGFDMKIREIDDRETASILRAAIEAHRNLIPPSEAHD